MKYVCTFKKVMILFYVSPMLFGDLRCFWSIRYKYLCIELLEFMELILKNLLPISEFNQPTINHLSQVSILPFSEIEKRN